MLLYTRRKMPLPWHCRQSGTKACGVWTLSQRGVNTICGINRLGVRISCFLRLQEFLVISSNIYISFSFCLRRYLQTEQ